MKSRIVSTLALPVLGVVASVLLAIRWSDRLPDPVATHWDNSGVDGTGSLLSLVVVTTAIGVACIAFALWPLLRPNMSQRRVGVTTLVWASVLTSGLSIAALDAQLDVPRASDAGSILPGLAASFVVACVAAAAAWFQTPVTPTPTVASTDLDRMALGSNETAVWTATVSSRVGAVVVAATLVFLVVVAIATESWTVGVVVVVGLGLVATILRWRITVDRRGLTCTSMLGFPTMRVPLAEMTFAESVHVGAMSDFGGFGIRFGGKARTGIVMRTGEALEVHRTNGRRFVVTVDDSTTAASLMNAQIERART